MSKWDDEYGRPGMPSSYRDQASGVVVWAADNWARLDGIVGPPQRGMDVGCGTARNSVYLAQRGMQMVAFDASNEAIAAARRRAFAAGVDVELLVHDLSDGLPARNATIDLVLDIFVYKHQMQSEARHAYRQELVRVLAPQGRVLVSLAEPTDGYYSTCPPFGDSHSGLKAVLDPEVGVGSVLFSLDELVAEMSDCFTLEMAWRKEKAGPMHGQTYERRTLATIWKRAADG